jgi:hypothetical protein
MEIFGKRLQEIVEKEPFNSFKGYEICMIAIWVDSFVYDKSSL